MIWYDAILLWTALAFSMYLLGDAVRYAAIGLWWDAKESLVRMFVILLLGAIWEQVYRHAFKVFTIAILLGMPLAASANYQLLPSGLYLWTPDSTLWNKTWYPGYYYCGAYYPGYYKYVYAGTYTPPITDEALMIQAVIRIRERQQYQSEQEAKANRLTNMAKDLGLVQPLGRLPGLNYDYYHGPFQTSAVAAQYNSALVGTFGTNVNSVWGYQQPAQTLAQQNTVLTNDQLFQLLQGAQQVTGQSEGGAQQAVAQLFKALGDGQAQSAKVAEINALGTNAVAFAKVLQVPQSTTTTTKATIGTVPIAVPPMPVAEPKQAAKAADIDSPWNISANKRCASCHYGNAGEKKAGGFSIADFPTMNATQKANVIKRIVPGLAPERDMMPPAGNERVPTQELAAWIELWNPANKKQ